MLRLLWQSMLTATIALLTLLLAGLHGCQQSILDLLQVSHKSSLLSLLGLFGSLILLALCHSALSCLVNGVFTMFFTLCSSSSLSAMMALKPALLTFCIYVLLLMSWVSMKSSIFFTIALVSMVKPCMLSTLSNGMGMTCSKLHGNLSLT